MSELCHEKWEVVPCIGINGHIVSYDIGPPVPEGATGGPVVASVFAGKEVADEIARLWNAEHHPLVRMVRFDEELGLYNTDGLIPPPERD